MKVVKRVNLKCSHHKEKDFLSTSFILNFLSIKDGYSLNCQYSPVHDLHQTLMLHYTLNLHRAKCQRNDEKQLINIKTSENLKLPKLNITHIYMNTTGLRVYLKLCMLTLSGPQIIDFNQPF